MPPRNTENTELRRRLWRAITIKRSFCLADLLAIVGEDHAAKVRSFLRDLVNHRYIHPRPHRKGEPAWAWGYSQLRQVAATPETCVVCEQKITEKLCFPVLKETKKKGKKDKDKSAARYGKADTKKLVLTDREPAPPEPVKNWRPIPDDVREYFEAKYK